MRTALLFGAFLSGFAGQRAANPVQYDSYLNIELKDLRQEIRVMRDVSIMGQGGCSRYHPGTVNINCEYDFSKAYAETIPMMQKVHSLEDAALLDDEPLFLESGVEEIGNALKRNDAILVALFKKYE